MKIREPEQRVREETKNRRKRTRAKSKRDKKQHQKRGGKDRKRGGEEVKPAKEGGGGLRLERPTRLASLHNKSSNESCPTNNHHPQLTSPYARL